MYTKRTKWKITLLIITLLIIVGVIVGVVKTNPTGGGFDPSFELGVVSTSDSEEDTSIYYYNNEGEIVYEQNRLKYAAFGYLEGEPPVSNGHLYAIPKGLQNEQDGTTIVDLNLETGAIEEYTIPDDLQGPSSISYQDGKIAVCNNLNGKSNVGLYDIKTKKTLIHTFDDEKQGCVMDVYLTGNLIICNGTESGGGKSFLHILDRDTLEIKKSIITKNDPSNFFEAGDNVLFTEPRQYEYQDRYVGILNLADLKVKEWKADVENGILSFKKNGAYQIIVDSDPANKEENIIKTMNKSKVIDKLVVKSRITQAISKGNDLYVLGFSDNYEGEVFKINISNSGNLSIEKSFPVKSKESLPPSFIFLNDN